MIEIGHARVYFFPEFHAHAYYDPSRCDLHTLVWLTCCHRRLYNK
jgi:hypothetical protein